MKTNKVVVIILAVVVLFLILIGSSVQTIDEGERGVLLTYGKITRIEEPGLIFILPFIQTVERISTRTETLRASNLAMYSFDQQIAELELTITYHHNADQIEEVYRQYGKTELYQKVVLPRVKEVTKSIFGQYTVARAIQDRAGLNVALNLGIKEAITGVPIVIDNIQVENVDFSDTYERAVEEAAKAKAGIERAKSELARVEQEAQQKVKNAEADATSTRMRADAEAYSVRQAGQAQADALTARANALRDNPELINLIKVERWNGVLPVTMVPNAALPFVEVR